MNYIQLIYYIPLFWKSVILFTFTWGFKQLQTVVIVLCQKLLFKGSTE